MRALVYASSGLARARLERIEQERGSNIFAVDVVNSADAAHFIVWKRNGWLAAYLPEEAAQHFSTEHRDPEGMHITTRVWLSSLGYNTNLVKAEEAPKSYADLLDPKWMGKIIKAHPAYAGSIMTATFRSLGTLAGAISRSSPSKRCCRSSLRPIHPRNWRSVSAR